MHFPPSPTTDEKQTYRIVILENPYENWAHPLVPELFKQMLSLKRFGYEGYYPRGFLPIDTSDYVGTHHLICEDTPELNVVAGYRSITLAQCETFHLKFPGIAVLDEDPGTEAHQLAAQKIITEAKNNGKTLSFGSSWTVHPKVRSDRATVEFLKDLARAMMVDFQTNQNIHEEMCLTVPKVKTDKYFGDLGYLPVTLAQLPLPPFGHAAIGNELVNLAHRTEFTSFSIETEKKHLELLKKQLHLRPTLTQIQKKTA